MKLMGYNDYIGITDLLFYDFANRTANYILCHSHGLQKVLYFGLYCILKIYIIMFVVTH